MKKPKFKLNKTMVTLTFVGGPRDGMIKTYASFVGGVRISGGKDSIQDHYYRKKGRQMVYEGLVDKLEPKGRQAV